MSVNFEKLKDRLIWSFLILLWLVVLWYLNHNSLVSSLVPLMVTLVLLVVSGLALSKTEGMGLFFDKLMSIRTEAAKVSWSSWESTRKTTLMVSVLIAIFALIMWMVDACFTLLVKNIL